ncbi:MAG: hypothetical protein QXT75_07290 [Desulfurococcaceae archaeon]
MSFEEFLVVYGIIIFIAILGAASAIWFFRVRRKLIILLRDTAILLEKHYNPSSKEYQWLGYLVGYKARYILPGKHVVYVMLTTVPKHSLIYYPIAKIAGRKDRLEIAVKPHDRIVPSEFYLVKKNSLIDRAVLRNSAGDRLNQMFTRELKGYYNYVVYYDDEKIYDKIVKLAEKTNLPITLIMMRPSENIISATYELSLNTLEEFLKFSDTLVRELTLPKALKK